MKKKSKFSKVLSLVLSVVMVFSLLPLSVFAEGETTKPTIWIVGDSTVSSFTDAYYYPRYGWGTQVDKYLDGSFEIKNIALSGRSSKSYMIDPEYQQLLTGMKSGDYLLIGFGHNDEKAEAERYTNPNGNYQTEGSFANSLYTNYIQKAQEVGCTPILCTPIVRRNATGTFTNNDLHITTGSTEYPGGDYAQAIKTLGTDVSIPVVDMTNLTKSLYEQLGASETLYLHAWTSSKEGSVDNTHTNIWGGKYNAYLVMKTIKELNISGLSEHIIDATAPTKSDTLVSNPNYVEPIYDNNLAQSEMWKDYGIWKGTAFGDTGGVPTTTNFAIGSDVNGDMNISVVGNKGKIAASTDGFAMYYYKVPVDSNFKLTANATINAYDVNDQVSFGLIARDDMYIDSYINTTMGDYVAAAPLKLKAQAPIWNSFARKSGALTQGGSCVNPVTVGSTIPLSIESTSDGYTTKFGDEAAVSGGFDFKLTAIDSDYVYVGMFVVRNANITFKDVKLLVDGVEVIALPETDAPTNVIGSYTGDGTSFTYTVTPIAGCEYSTDDATWQDSNVFTGIEPNAQKTFYARYKETDTSKASPSTNTGVVTFNALENTQIPTLNYTLTQATDGNTVVITEVEGAEYKFGDDNWSTTNSKTFTTEESVVVEIRYAKTNTHNASTSATETIQLKDKTYKLTVQAKVGGTVVGSGSFKENELVEITAKANANYEFVNWSSTVGEITNATSSSTTFKMPAKETTVTANFKRVESSNNTGGSGSTITKKPITSTQTNNDNTQTTTENKPVTTVVESEKAEVTTETVEKVTETLGEENKEVNTALLENTYTSLTSNTGDVLSTPYTLKFDLSNVEVADTSKLVAVSIDPLTGEIVYLGGRLNEDDNSFVTDTKLANTNFAVIVANPEDYNQIELQINNSDVVLNGTTQQLDTYPVIKNNTTYVPVRVISELLGQKVSYDATTKTAIIETGDKTVRFSTLSNTVDTPIIVNDRMLIPVRSVSENLGANVNWFESDKTVQITK